MQVTECASGKKKHVTARALDQGDFKKITKKEFSFDWKVAKKNAEVYKLCLTEDECIIGLVALVDTPTDQRIEVKLLASSLKNVGAEKVYEGIAGCLIAFACREALVRYGDLACVSLLPKTELKQHYMKKYGMLDGGRQVYLEGIELIELIKKYPL
jgi:hypothetical protein